MNAEIRDRIEELSSIVTDRHFESNPQLETRYGSAGRARCIEDTRFHLSFLATALETGVDAIFIDYIAWSKVVLASRRVGPDDLTAGLRIIGDVLKSRLDAAAATDAIRVLEIALAALPAMPTMAPSFIDISTEAGVLARKYLEALLALDGPRAIRTVATALTTGMLTRQLCVEVLEPVQHEVGRLWQINEISIAVEHFCTSITQQVLSQIGSGRRAHPDPSRKRAVTMCAPGELHDMGLRAISEFLAIDGWHVMPLGANVPAAAAAQLCADFKAELVLVSATLPTNIGAVTKVIEELRKQPALRDRKFLVGGGGGGGGGAAGGRE
jgi:methanogenic corrinoid protein MtbC1